MASVIAEDYLLGRSDYESGRGLFEGPRDDPRLTDYIAGWHSADDDATGAPTDEDLM